MKFFLISFFVSFIFNHKAFSLDTIAKQAILYDYETKTIIFEKNSEELMSPSSMSKIMTIYYVFKKIKDGDLKLSDKFKVSKKAWKKGGSKMFVNVNTMVSVEDLIRGIIVQSGNDACIAIAEGISGSEALFAEELNLLAKEIGMINSSFTNSTGWPDPDHLTTIQDLLTLTVRTIEDFPELYYYYAEKEFTYGGIRQLNRNPLLFNEINADGLKTGHTSLGGYGLVASVLKNNRRLILILNGLKRNKDRSEESERLVKVGFNQYKVIDLYDKNQTITNLQVWGGRKKNVDVYSKESVNITVPNRIKNDLVFTIKHYKPLLAPIEKDQKVADLIVKNKETRFENKDKIYHEKIRKNFLKLSKKYKNMYKVDASLSKKVIHKKIIDHLNKLLFFKRKLPCVI